MTIMTSLYWWLVASYLWIDTRTVNAFSTTTRVVMPTNSPSSPHSMTLFAKTSHNNDNDDSFFLEQRLSQLKQPAMEYVTAFGLEQQGPSALLYALGSALKDLPLGFRGMPIVWKRNQLETIFGEEDTMIVDCFTMEHLETALEDDFLDAARGSTDNRRGWKITDVSVPRGESFEQARMTFHDVQLALEKGTVIFNAAGAHIPRLAGPSLALTDATALPCALNIYVTSANKRTSAPPHTDKQDVLVLLSTGSKLWKVFAPPDPSLKPNADPFARGKLDDSLPLYQLAEEGELLLETTLEPGDVLFVPAGFPHTTSTTDSNTTSVHLTLGMDHHIWELDYAAARRLSYLRAGRKDGLESDNVFVGAINNLDAKLYADLTAELPLGLLEDESMVPAVVRELERISMAVDEETAKQVNNWEETVRQVRAQGVELLEIHRDMYLAAIEEGRVRIAEDAMTAHLPKQTMSPERIQRLSLFRVQRYFDQISVAKEKLREWSLSNQPTGVTDNDANWEFNAPVQVGDPVEADLGGAFFAATVTRASNDSYDVAFFDGDRETGLVRNQIKLLQKPKPQKLTAKQLKRLKKKQKQQS